MSLLGNTIAAVAIPWFVLVTTGSATRTGVAAFAATLPLALGALFGGTITDRIGPRATSTASDLVSAGAIAGIPALHTAGALEFWHILALAFVGGLFDAPGQAAREALLPELADRADVSRERASALWTTTEHAGYVLGAPLAGIFIAGFGAPAALWLDAASFIASALLVAGAVPAARVALVPAAYLRQLADGLAFVAHDRPLLSLLVLSTLGNFVIGALASVLLPVYARELGGAGQLGLLVGSYGAGGLVGALGYGLAARRIGRHIAVVAIWIVYPAACWLLATRPSLALAALLLFLIGLLAGVHAPIEQLLRQERTPVELRGRVFSTYMAALAAVVPPAMLVAGLLVDGYGLGAALGAFAAANTALGVLAIVWVAPVLRGNDGQLAAGKRG